MSWSGNLQRLHMPPTLLCRDDLEALVYCMLEMEQPNLRLPWNTDLTTNAEAAAGWSMGQLKRMSEQKEKAWHDACKKVGGPGCGQNKTCVH